MRNNSYSCFVFWLIFHLDKLVKTPTISALNNLADNYPPGFKIEQARIAVFASYFLCLFS